MQWLTLGLAALLAYQTPAAPPPAADRVRVFCVAAAETAGFVDSQTSARQDSVNDVVKALADSREVVVVDSKDQADLVLEIVERTIVKASTPYHTKSGTQYTSTSTYILRARLRVGTYSVPIEGRPVGLVSSWKGAAGSVAGTVEKWVRNNRERIPASGSATASPATPRPSLMANSVTDPGNPRQVAMAWLMSDAEQAPSHLVASAREQIAALRDKGRDPLASGLVLVYAPGEGLRKKGSLTLSGQTVHAGSTMQVTFEPEATAGDYALVPLSVRAGGKTARGSIELTREGGAWRVAAADLGPQARWPRFDSPAFITDAAQMVERVRVR